MGFDAYGLSRDMPDPVAGALAAMLDHIHQLDERIAQLCRSQHLLDERMPQGDIEPLQLPEFCRDAVAASASQDEAKPEVRSPTSEKGTRKAS